MITGGLGLLVLTLDTGQPFDKTDLLLSEHVRGIARFLPLSLLRDCPQQIEIALGAKLLQTAFHCRMVPMLIVLVCPTSLIVEVTFHGTPLRSARAPAPVSLQKSCRILRMMRA